MNTERKALSWLFVIIAVVVLALLLYSAANAQSINYREWLLEYEQVDVYTPPAVRPLATFLSGYPAPEVEPTVAYDMGYPAPALEPTAKPKKQKPKVTTTNPEDIEWYFATITIEPMFTPIPTISPTRFCSRCWPTPTEEEIP